jgi:hypothetical protein
MTKEQESELREMLIKSDALITRVMKLDKKLDTLLEELGLDSSFYNNLDGEV